LENKVFDIIDARCSHEVHHSICSGWTEACHNNWLQTAKKCIIHSAVWNLEYKNLFIQNFALKINFMLLNWKSRI